ncbi:phage tail tape measure protein [uncultured Acinetobacter sp.]|uniref:phage tail tape measure protein n=1 Tax=uncultured Acinetobacter sp. TaxID=165433 RepID=UPI00258895AA|nr:phage tail tape measure protein [uncultured Acinetobacter sp.]
MATLNLQVLFDAKDKITGPMKVIIGGSQDLSKAFKQTSAELKALQDQQRSVDRFKQTQTALEKTQQTLKGYRQELKELQKIEKSGNTLTDTQIKKMSSLEQGIRRLKSTEASQRNELNAHTQALSKAGFNVDKVAKGVDRLTQEESDLKNKIHQTTMELNKRRVELDKNNESQKRFTKIQSALQKGSDFAKKSMVVAGAATVAMVVPVKLAIDYESSMADVKKVFNGTEAEFKSINTEILDMSTRLPMAAKDIAAIVAAGAQSGIASKELTTFAETAVKMGVAFDISAEQSGQSMAELRTAFRMSQDQVTTLADQINYLGNNTPAAAKGIMEIVQRIGPLGEVGGFAASSIAALGATLRGMGISEEIAATGIKNTMLALVAGESATKGQKAAYKELGIDCAKVAKDMQKDANGTTLMVLKQIAKLDKYKQAAVLADLFGKESLSAIAPLLTNMEALEKNLGLVADKSKYAGSMEQEYAARAATSANNIQLLKNSVSALGIDIGTVLLPPLNMVIDKARGLANQVIAWAKENPALAATLTKIAVGGILLVGGLSALALGITALLGPIAILKVTLGTLGLGFSAVGAIFSPVGLVILGIVAAVAGAAYLIYRNWEPISGFFIGIWSTIKTAFNGGIRGVTALILNWSPLGLFYSVFAKVLSWFGIDLPKQFTGFGSMIIQGLIDGIKSKFDGLKGVWEKVTSYMPDFMRKRMDIHSPSRVMAGMGGHIVDGIGVGLNQRTPALQTQFNRTLGVFDASPAMPSTPTLKRRFTDSIGITETPVSTTGRFDDRSQTAPKFKRVAAINSPRSISVTNSDNITIHINAGGGGPIRNAANEVRQALAERDRQRNADLRRMLTDRE